jgi:hypothetical protein
MRDFFTPRLMMDSAGNRPALPAVGIGNLNRVQPEVRIADVQPEPVRGLATVKVVIRSVERNVRRDGKDIRMNSGAFDLRLFRDGQIAGQYPDVDSGTAPSFSEQDRQQWRNEHRIVDQGEKIVSIPHVKLPSGGGQVVFTAYAFNRDRVKSETSLPLPYKVEPRPETERPRAYLITMAVDVNRSGWDLNLAVASAERAAELWSRRLAADYEVVRVRLESKQGEGPRIAPNPTATKHHLRAVLDILAGRGAGVSAEVRQGLDSAGRLREAQPGDAVVLYIASHGYADPGGRFYIVPFDTGALPGTVNERILARCHEKPGEGCKAAGEFLRDSISADELASWWRGVDAGEMVMMVDSCHSGAVPGQGFRPGPLGDRGFGQLSYDKGMRILAAAQPGQPARATNLGRLGHTLLVEGLQMAAEGRPELSVAQWLRLSAEELPRRARQLYAGIAEDDIQLPEFLDFGSRRRNPRAP